MPLYVRGTNVAIRGTLERVHGVARATGFRGTGAIDYVGDTEMWWDGAETVMRDGQRVWVDEDGDEHLESEIEERDGPINDEREG